MVKIKELDNDAAERKAHRSGMKLFPFIREVWPKKSLKENIKSDKAKDSVKLDKQM